MSDPEGDQWRLVESRPITREETEWLHFAGAISDEDYAAWLANNPVLN